MSNQLPCPHCGTQITSLNDQFAANGYGTDFRFNCPACRGEVLCLVELAPTFRLVKPRCHLCHRREVPACQPYCDDCQASIKWYRENAKGTT